MEDLENVQKEYSMALIQCKENEKKLSNKMHQLEIETERNCSLFSDEKSNLIKENSRLETKVFELEQRCKEIQNNYLAQVEGMSSFQENMREEAKNEVQKILHENKILKRHLSNVANELNQIKVSQSELIDRLKRKCEVYDSDVNRIAHEKEEMTKLIATNQNIIDNLKKDLESCEGKLSKTDDQCGSINDDLKKSNEIIEDLKDENRVLEDKISYIENEYKTSFKIVTKEKENKIVEVAKLQKLNKQSKNTVQALENEVRAIRKQNLSCTNF